MIVAPIVAPTLTGLTVTPALRGNLLTWVAITDPTLFSTEVWASTVNNRNLATKVATVRANAFMHLTNAGVTWYYWIRAVSTYGRADGAWTPTSATGGILSTSLLAQTSDIAPNSVTAVYYSTSSTVINQSAYDTWENIFSVMYAGTGNTFILDVRHYSNFSASVIGSSATARGLDRMTLNEYTVYSAGTVSVTNGSAIVTGSGTSWLSTVAAGNKFFIPGLTGTKYTILSVDSDTQITLSTNYTGTTSSGGFYYIITNTTVILTVTQDTTKLSIVGPYCISSGDSFNHRIPVSSTVGKLYEILLDWALARDNNTWTLFQSSVLRVATLEEVKR